MALNVEWPCYGFIVIEKSQVEWGRLADIKRYYPNDGCAFALPR